MSQKRFVLCSVVAALALVMACSKSSQTPVSPSGSDGVAEDDVTDGVTLKASAPTVIAPVNGEQPDSLVLTAGKAEAKFNKNLALSYQFQITTDSASVISECTATIAPNSGPTVSYTPSCSLDFDQPHKWKVRARSGDFVGPWSAEASFKTPPAPSVSCASNNGPAIVNCVAAKYPQYLAAGVSLSERQANMSFLRDRIIEAGKCGGLDLGQNLKRGGPDLSIDFLAWRQPGGEMGVDIGFDYDNTSMPLRLGWSEAGFGATYKAFPVGSCSGV